MAIVVPFLLPDRYSLAPTWVGPALLLSLLVAHMIADPGRIDPRRVHERAIAIEVRDAWGGRIRLACLPYRAAGHSVTP